MNSFLYNNYNMESGSSNAFTTGTSNNNTTTLSTSQDPSNAGEDISSAQGVDVMLSASVTSFPGPSSSQLPDSPSQQEAMASDTASNIDVDEILYNIRMRSCNLNIPNEQNGNFFYDNSSQAGSLASQIWSDRASPEIKPHSSDTFEFLIKSISSANNYLSMLTREQLSVLRSIRPGLLYEFLQEIARVRSERRMRRALPHECAFCKNNGENEDIYASHALKDFRGRVLCPVLRAFSCPKCGATGERAHTIKYCPENIEIGSDRLVSRRRFPPSTSLIVGANTTTTNNGTGYDSITPNTPASSPLQSLTASWNNFHLN